MIFLGAFQIARKKGVELSDDSIIYIGLFGAILFYILWEAAQRYSLSFLPWMIIPLGLIYRGLNEKGDTKQESKMKSWYQNNKEKIAKIGSITIMLITLVLLNLTFDRILFFLQEPYFSLIS